MFKAVMCGGEVIILSDAPFFLTSLLSVICITEMIPTVPKYINHQHAPVFLL